jgi:hypothetical protein
MDDRASYSLSYVVDIKCNFHQESSNLATIQDLGLNPPPISGKILTDASER